LVALDKPGAVRGRFFGRRAEVAEQSVDARPIVLRHDLAASVGGDEFEPPLPCPRPGRWPNDEPALLGLELDDVCRLDVLADRGRRDEPSVADRQGAQSACRDLRIHLRASDRQGIRCGRNAKQAVRCTSRL
jgi:hypothetical protein